MFAVGNPRLAQNLRRPPPPQSDASRRLFAPKCLWRWVELRHQRALGLTRRVILAAPGLPNASATDSSWPSSPTPSQTGKSSLFTDTPAVPRIFLSCRKSCAENSRPRSTARSSRATARQLMSCFTCRLTICSTASSNESSMRCKLARPSFSWASALALRRRYT